LEAIGDDTRACVRLWHGVVSQALGKDVADQVIGSFPSRAWAAEITGLDPKYGFARKFLKPSVDYSEANSVGSRGVYRYYWLEEGKVYDVSSPKSWKRTDRYFCRVEDGNLIEMGKDEVKEWLKNRSG
jgi:hypothetical protein